MTHPRSRSRRRTAAGLAALTSVAVLTLTGCGSGCCGLSATDGSASKDGTVAVSSINGQKIALPATDKPTAVSSSRSDAGNA